MAKQITVQVLLNRGRRGVPLGKLPKIIGELSQFLEDLSKDLGLEVDGWQGVEFKETHSLGFSAVTNSLVEEDKSRQFNESATNVILNRPDDRVSRKTRNQYAKIAGPIDPDEAVEIGVEQTVQPSEYSEIDLPVQWYQLTKQIADSIQKSVRGRVKASASAQGIIHSVFIEADQPHFQLRELSTKNLITCNYRDNRYDQLAEALKHRRAVVHVYGYSITDTLSRKIEAIDVDHIDVAPSVGKEFLERFIGCAPGIAGGDTQSHIDSFRIRGS